MALTTRGLAAIKPGEWQSDDGRKGAGRLVAFGMKGGGISFFFRYTRPDGTRDALPIGHYDPKGRAGLTLQAASDTAGALSKRYQSGERDLRGAIEAEERERERQRRDSEAQSAADAARERATLGALLMGYVEQLRRAGKPSARAVELAVQRHIAEAWPILWDTPAADVTTDDLLGVVAKIADADKLREAAKVRSYLSAAYSAGIRARQDARGLPALRDLRIAANPARDLVTVDGASNTRERALSVAELRAYWKRIAAMPDPAGALLRFHLLTGGQRVEQLGRLTMQDYDADLLAVGLRDGKGRRKTPRLHDVPLVAEAAKAMQAMQGGTVGPHLFTITAGESGAVYSTVQHRIREVADAMLAAGELERGLFTVGDLRRTVETRLAALGVSREVRAQLQSHGLGGVQARHYDRHDYLAEKRDALEKLYRLVTGKGASVAPIKRRGTW